jgi:hypothetical protein
MLEEDNLYTLLIIETYAEDSGKYECVAINGAGEARCDALCNIEQPTSPEAMKPATPGTEKAPEMIEPLESKAIPEGQCVEFRTRCSGKPEPTAQWFKGDKLIKPSKYFQMVVDREYYSLRISEAFPEDEGKYTCVLSNPSGEARTTAELKVMPPDTTDSLPKIIPMKDVIVEEGNPAQFKTTIIGKQKMNVQWFREGLLIPESPDFQVSSRFFNLY